MIANGQRIEIFLPRWRRSAIRPGTLVIIVELRQSYPSNPSKREKFERSLAGSNVKQPQPGRLADTEHDSKQTFIDGPWIPNATKVAKEFYVGRSAVPNE
jgi:hypothetical protein